MNKTNPSPNWMKAFLFFAFGTISVLYTFFPLYLQNMGFDKIQIGLLMAGGPFVSLLANPFWGYLSDRTGQVRRILFIMLLGNAVLIQFVFQLNDYAWIYALMLLFFFFQTSLFSQTNSLILNEIDGTAMRFGAFRLWGSLGWALMAVAGGPVIDWLGIERLWIVYNLLLIITLYLVLRLPQGRNKKKMKGKAKLVEAFANRRFLWFLLLGIMISVPNAMNGTFVSLYISELGGSATLIGWSVFAQAGFEVLVFMVLDRYLKQEIRFLFVILAVVSLIFALRWLLMSVVTDPIQIVFIQLLHCVSFGAYFYAGTSLTGMMIPPEYRASGQAAYALTWNGISGIIAGLAGGWALEVLGPPMTYQMGAAIAVLGAAGFAAMRWSMREEPAHANP